MVIHKQIHLTTTKQFQIFAVTKQVEQVLAESKIKSGICTIFVPHSTASVRLNDNESLLHQDIMKMFYRTVPMDISYGHDLFELRNESTRENRSNGHAHVKSFLTGSSQSIPVMDGTLHLGEHQDIFFVEYDGGRQRNLIITIIGE